MTSSEPRRRPLEYTARLIWEGNLGDGTSSYAAYGREYRILVAGKADLLGSADPVFRGVADRHDPEDLFLAAIAACHMLSYLALCARGGVRVLAYEDGVSGTVTLDASGGGRFTEVTLRPRVTVADAQHENAARALHAKAHELCFIANSCSVPIRHEATVQVDSTART